MPYAFHQILFISLALGSTTSIFTQVPVSEEPMHRIVFQNEYIRLLDVWIEPGDTTKFHINSTPSLFTQFIKEDFRTFRIIEILA